MAKPRLFNRILKIVDNKEQALEIVKMIAESKSPNIIKKAKYEYHNLTTNKPKYNDWDDYDDY